MTDHFRKFKIYKIYDGTEYEWGLYRESIYQDGYDFVNRYDTFAEACFQGGRLIDMLVHVDRQFKKAEMQKRLLQLEVYKPIIGI